MLGGGGRPDVVGVAGIGAGYSVSEVAFDPGEGGVAEPVGGDALSGDPGEAFAESSVEGRAVGRRVRAKVESHGQADPGGGGKLHTQPGTVDAR